MKVVGHRIRLFFDLTVNYPLSLITYSVTLKNDGTRCFKNAEQKLSETTKNVFL